MMKRISKNLFVLLIFFNNSDITGANENLNWIIDTQKSGMIDEIDLKKQIFNLLKKIGE